MIDQQTATTRSRTNGRATREKILQAAREIIIEKGTDCLSIDRVIKYAGISKGAFMYHFPTRQSLIEALVSEYAQHLEKVQKTLEAQFQHTTSPMLAAYGQWYKDFTTGEIDQGSSPLLALSLASRDNRQLMQPVRDWYRNHCDRLKTQGCGPAKAFVVNLAYDALFFHHLFGIDVLTKEEKEMIIHTLNDLVAKTDLENE